MFGLVLDRRSERPLGQQIAHHLRQWILGGQLAPGSRLPSSRDLAREWTVARNVVTTVYDQLVAEGFLEARVGSGTRVAQGAARRIPPPPFAVGEDRPRPLDQVDFAAACGHPDLVSFPLARWRSCLLRSWDALPEAALGFADVRGDPGLRAALVSWLARTKGLVCGADQVFITPGITPGLVLTAGFLRHRADRAVVEDPALPALIRQLAGLGYSLDRGLVDASGMSVAEVPARASGRLWVVSPSHQFPSGALMTLARRFELLNRISQEGGWVFEDDYDGDLRFRGGPVPPLATLDPDRVFYAGTFNKSLFPSLRLGFVVVPARLVSALVRYRESRGDWGALTQQRALALFVAEGSYDKRLATLRQLYRNRRDRVDQGLVRAFGPEAGLEGAEAGAHGWFRLPDAPRKALDGSSGVRLAALSDYTKTPELWRGCYLLGWGNLSFERIEVGLARLAGLTGRSRSAPGFGPAGSGL